MNQYNIHNIKINPADFQHPMDKNATRLIQSSAAFRKCLEFISKQSLEKQMQCIYRSSLAQLTPKTAPGICRMAEEACEMFGAETVPELFLQRSYTTAVTMMGIEKPLILLSTELLKDIKEEMLWGLIAAEISGIRNGFGEIRFAEWLCDSAGIIPAVISRPLSKLFKEWHKYLQFSHDRAALIAIGDFNKTMCAVLAGEIPMEILMRMDFSDPNCSYMKQSREFLENKGHWTETLRDIKAFSNEGVFYAARYVNLYQFMKNEYWDITEDFMEEI